MIEDWFYKEFAAAWLELAGLTQHAEDARANGASADWSAIHLAAKALAEAKFALVPEDMKIMGWNEARIAIGREAMDATTHSGCDIIDAVPQYVYRRARCRSLGDR